MSDPGLLLLAPRLYRLRIPGGAAHLLNCYLWVDEDGVTLIDTGWPDSAELIGRALQALGRRREDVTRIVLTHFHEDHAGSAAEIAEWAAVGLGRRRASDPSGCERTSARTPVPRGSRGS